jgi:hypothetical protein
MPLTLLPLALPLMNWKDIPAWTPCRFTLLSHCRYAWNLPTIPHRPLRQTPRLILRIERYFPAWTYALRPLSCSFALPLRLEPPYDTKCPSTSQNATLESPLLITLDLMNTRSLGTDNLEAVIQPILHASSSDSLWKILYYLNLPLLCFLHLTRWITISSTDNLEARSAFTLHASSLWIALFTWNSPTTFASLTWTPVGITILVLTNLGSCDLSFTYTLLFSDSLELHLTWISYYLFLHLTWWITILALNLKLDLFTSVNALTLWR